jgi:predicted Zn-ribbon and HTH transcriptional regulator
MKKLIVKSKAKCPKCKNKKELTLIEVWKGHTISWEVKNGEFDRNDGALEHGDAYKVECKCNKCGHQWTIQKAFQIDDVVV